MCRLWHNLERALSPPIRNDAVKLERATGPFCRAILPTAVRTEHSLNGDGYQASAFTLAIPTIVDEIPANPKGIASISPGLRGTSYPG